MGVYLPNIDAADFNKLCAEKGLEFICVSVPPHGDLVDRDVVKKQGYFFPFGKGSAYCILLRSLMESPAIIPAEYTVESE